MNDDKINKNNGMSEIVKTVTGWLGTIIFIYGCYDVLFGHILPGGGFSGGVIIGGLLILYTLSFGRNNSRSFRGNVTGYIFPAAVIVFVGMALGGYLYNGSFFVNFMERLKPSTPFRLFSSGNILIFNIIIGINVSTAIFTGFSKLSSFTEGGKK